VKTSWRSRLTLTEAAVCSVLGLILVGGALALVEFCVSDDRRGTAVVTGRDYLPPRYDTRTVYDGGVTRTEVDYSPARYRVRLSIDGRESWYSTSPGTYERVTNGQPSEVRYRWGKYSGVLYIYDAQFQ